MARDTRKAVKGENDALPANLRLLLEETGTSQKQLGEALGTTPQNISLYATSGSKPDWKTIVKIADYFHVSTDWLLGRSEVRSTEATLKAACEYTGLSENIIESLHNVFISHEPYRDSETGEVVTESEWSEIWIEQVKALLNEYGTTKEAKVFFETLTKVNENEISDLRFLSHQQALALLLGNSVLSGEKLTPAIKRHLEDAADKFIPDLKSATIEKAFQEWHDLTLFKIQQAAIAFADRCISENMKKWGYDDLLHPEDEDDYSVEDMEPYIPEEWRADDGNDTEK